MMKGSSMMRQDTEMQAHARHMQCMEHDAKPWQVLCELRVSE
jgi:hypothetical protein